ncbi:hypothetical protein [Flagellimonas sp. CMM7]|uniref:hypothetical protein n=1 Tax=Flagellimonas sp. CMM7 TaxID=2654676 RepID=UPI0013D8333D|nr:hypothetical protein [Flagellimonas sp. CMM7]UII79568.1 hypothetical protein LV704_18145 [Flagellimonas sp. CMM7]
MKNLNTKTFILGVLAITIAVPLLLVAAVVCSPFLLIGYAYVEWFQYKDGLNKRKLNYELTCKRERLKL